MGSHRQLVLDVKLPSWQPVENVADQRSLGWQWSDQLVVSSPISLKNMFVKMASVHPQFSGWKVQRICWNYHPVIWLSQGSFSKIHVTRWRNEGQQSTKAYLKQLCLVGRLASINVFLSQVAPKQVPKQTIAFTRTWPLSSLFNGCLCVRYKQNTKFQDYLHQG